MVFLFVVCLGVRGSGKHDIKLGGRDLHCLFNAIPLSVAATKSVLGLVEGRLGQSFQFCCV